VDAALRTGRRYQSRQLGGVCVRNCRSILAAAMSGLNSRIRRV
jgi:hypothetical protein